MEKASSASTLGAALLAGFACLALLAAPAAAEVQVSSALSPESAGVGEMVTYTIEAHGGGFDSVAFVPTLRLDNLELAAGPSVGENISFVNGALSRSYRLTWELRVHGPGKARVRASIKLNGQVLELPAREIAVEATPPPGAPGGSGSGGIGSAPRQPSADADDPSQDPFARFFGPGSPLRHMLEPPRQRPSSPRVFLRAEVTPEQPYVGQQALWTLYLYTREEVNAINQSSVPSFHGFWVSDIPQPQNLPHDMVDVDGERFARVPLMRKAIFALHPGPATIEPVDVDLMVRPAEIGIWGTTLDPPAPVRLRSPAVPVSRRPLPLPPPGFAGAVGRVALRATLEPRDLRLGEAATLTVKLDGEGHLSGMPAPDVELPSGLKLLPPQQQGEDSVAGTTVRGQRTWSFAVIPERAGSYQVKVPPVPYFDPLLGAYRVAAAPSFALTAEPARAALPAPPAEIAASLRPPSGRADLLRSAWARARRAWPAPLPLLPVLLVFLSGAVAALAIGALSRRRTGSGAPASPRARAEARLAAAAHEDRPRQVASEIQEAVGELLAQRWAVPVGSPPRQWRELAAARGADPATAADLGRLADDLHYLRYAPQLSATGGLKSEALASCRRLLRGWK